MRVQKQDFLPECECHEEHRELIEKGKALLPETTELYDLSDFFKVLGDSTRLGILFAIDGASMCVCDIAAALGMTKSAVSHQLKVLRQNRGGKRPQGAEAAFDQRLLTCTLKTEQRRR